MWIDRVSKAEKSPQGTFSGPHTDGDKHLIREVSAEASKVCLCGHTAYLHGDRAIVLCGGYSTVARKQGYEIPIRCNCKGFTEGDSPEQNHTERMIPDAEG